MFIDALYLTRHRPARINNPHSSARQTSDGLSLYRARRVDVDADVRVVARGLMERWSCALAQIRKILIGVASLPDVLRAREADREPLVSVLLKAHEASFRSCLLPGLGF